MQFLCWGQSARALLAGGHSWGAGGYGKNLERTRVSGNRKREGPLNTYGTLQCVAGSLDWALAEDGPSRREPVAQSGDTAALEFRMAGSPNAHALEVDKHEAITRRFLQFYTL